MSDVFSNNFTYDPNDMARDGYALAHSGPSDDKLIVGFYRKSVLNVAKSREMGKRICEDHDYVIIQHPGETLMKLDRPVQETDKHRWPRQWSQYVQGKQQIPEGIPLTLLFPASPSISDMLIGYNIHTVEQLANLSAHAIGTIGMGCQEWVNKAQAYLKQAEKGVDFHRFEKAIQEKDQKIATLERQLNELSQQVARLANVRANPPSPLTSPQFDAQAYQIAALKEQEIIAPPSQVFSSDIVSPDLSGQVKRRGRPPGSRNKPKEL